MKNRPKSWKAVRQERRKENFVGRAEHLRPFLENFTGETPSYMVFAVTGEGGVGKSTLLRQFTHIATLPNIDAIVVMCDDRYLSPAAAMGYVAGELARLEITHKEFDERYKKYRELREEIETDPKAPRGAIDLLARGMTDLAIKSGRKIPGVGVVFEGADEKAAGETVAQGVHYLLSRWTNKDEVILLRETDRVLTPLFLQLLAKACVKGRAVLMFDVFERTGPLLSPWLLSLFNFEYGEFDTNLSFVISGRDPLEQHWTELAGDICHIALEPFTLDETRLYLGNQEIFDDPLVKLIHEDTGGLPVLVELLAATRPQLGAPLPDVSKDAVERFLQWIPQEDRRRVALLAAVPRQFNRDILSAALGNDATDTFQWLSGQSFVRRKAEHGYVYHEKVRELILRHLRNTVPKDLDETHSRLADYFAPEKAALNLEGESAYRSETWRRLEGERVYHILSAQPDRNSHEVVNAFMHSFQWHRGFAEEIARACQQCGQEKGLQTIRELAGALSDIYRAYDQNEYQMRIETLGSLERHNALTDIARCEIHALRGHMFWSNGKHDQALADFGRAIELDPNYAWAVACRGLTYQAMGKREEALADFDRAIELHPELDWAVMCRGMTYQAMGKDEEALADFGRAIGLDPNYAWAVARRGETYRQMGRDEEALADFDRAIELHPELDWALDGRGLTYQAMGRDEEALADFGRAIELDPNYAWAVACRGETYRQMGRDEEALADFNRAIELDQRYVGAIACRGETYRQMGRDEEALADFDRAIELDPNYAWAVARRGLTYQAMGRDEEALADFDRVIELDPELDWAIACRGETYRQMGRDEEALADFNRAIELDPNYAWAVACRGETYRQMGKDEEALADFGRAIELDPELDWALAGRGETYRQMGRDEEALVEYQRVIKLDSKNSNYRVGLAACCRVLGLMDEYYRQIAIARELVVQEDDYNRACFAAICGENDDALALLRMALEKKEIPLVWPEHDPDFDPLRGDPRFAALIEEMRARFATGST